MVGSFRATLNLLVVIDNLHVIRIALVPAKADASLIVDPDAMLTRPAARELFEPVARRHPKIRQDLRRIQHQELPTRDPLEIPRPAPGRLAVEDLLGLPVPEAPDHPGMLTRGDINVKRYDMRRLTFELSQPA